MKRLVLLTLVFCIAGCDGQDSQERRIRHPQLTQVEEQVRRSVENAIQQWREQLNVAELPEERARAYAQLGQVYLAHHFDEAASDALDFATSQLTTNPHWYFYLAIARDRSYRLPDAEEALTASIELREHPEVRFSRANVRARLGDVAGALDDIRLLKENARESVTEGGGEDSVEDGGNATPYGEAAWYALEAELFARQQRYEESAISLSAARDLVTDASALNFPAAWVSDILGDRKKASQLISSAGAQMPVIKQPLTDALSALSRGAQYYLERGRTWMQTRNFRQAAVDFGAAADIAPSSHEARLAYARALEIVGQVDEAERQYLEAVKLAPESAVTHYFLGMLYERRREDDASREYYANALAADPAYLPPRLALAHVHFRNKNYEEALVHYGEYAAVRDEDFEPKYYAGLAALALGFCETAPPWFEQAAEANSYSREAQEGLARSFAVCSDDPDELSRAQDIGERMEESRPDAAAAATLAMVHAALNDFESAIRLQELAIRRSDEQRVNGQRDRLTQYESGERARVAWLPGDPVFNPPRLTMRVLL